MQKAAAAVSGSISAPDLLVLGINNVAYIRPVRMKDAEGFGLFSADGARITLVGSFDEARIYARQIALDAHSVH